MMVDMPLAPAVPSPEHPPAPPPAVTLPERLRLETRELHAAAERSGVMGQLLRGRLPLPQYRALLANLLALYRALETALQACRADPRVAPVHLPQLFRAPALACDLAALSAVPRNATATAPAGPSSPPVIEDAALAYARRLAQLAQAGSPALVAHAYVRYLGDLYGGQALKRVVTRAYGVGDEGTRFYGFGTEAEVQAQRNAFRAALAAVPATPDEADLIVAEARWAFEQHRRLFEELAARPVPS